MYSESYFENDVLHQEPVELIRMLYTKAVVKLGEAAEHLAAGRIAERSNAIGHASEILVELQSSIDREKGQDIGLRLAQLYDYMLARLAEANAKQEAEPILECRALLETILQGWSEAAAELRPQREEPSDEAVQTTGEAGHAWTL